MERSVFVKSMMGIFGLAYLPDIPFNQYVRQYEKVYVKQVFVRGFQYYEGPVIIDEINKSGSVELVRESENEFDRFAIAVHFNQKKIGFLPRESNKTLSILMDTELLKFHAEITHIEPDASDWEKIRIAVYALKEITSENDLEKIEPYSLLKTPHYYSITSGKDHLIHVDSDAIKDYL